MINKIFKKKILLFLVEKFLNWQMNFLLLLEISNNLDIKINFRSLRKKEKKLTNKCITKGVES